MPSSLCQRNRKIPFLINTTEEGDYEAKITQIPRTSLTQPWQHRSKVVERNNSITKVSGRERRAKLTPRQAAEERAD